MQEVFKPLRSNSHYLAFIEAVTFYHQHQREVKTDPYTGEKYIETTPEDIRWANHLLKDILLAKSDELSGACRSFFEKLKKHLKEEGKTSFYAKDIRCSFRVSYPTLKRYLLQLNQHGYVKITGGDRYKSGYEYEITSWDEYRQLSEGIDNALDRALKQIEEKQSSGSVAQ